MAEGTIPDPGISLSESINAMGVLHFEVLKSGSNPVLESFWTKLRDATHLYVLEHPDEFEAVKAEIEMRKRFADSD